MPPVLAELHGAPRQRGKTVRVAKLQAEAKVPGHGEVHEAPAHLTPAQRQDWDYAIENAPPGLLKRIDRGILMVWITACDIHRQASLEQSKVTLVVMTTRTFDVDGKQTGGGNPIQSPFLGIINTQAGIMIRAASELGFSPASRPRIFSQPSPGEAMTSVPGGELRATKKRAAASGNIESLDAWRAQGSGRPAPRR